jgi:transcriptional regulator with XRE-family HTH domain
MPMLGARVRQLRAERNLSQKELAVAARVSRSWLSMVESGDTPSPAADKLDRVATALGTTTAYLITGREERHSETTSIVVSNDDAPLMRQFQRLPRWARRWLLKAADSLIEEVSTSEEQVEREQAESDPTGQPDSR